MQSKADIVIVLAGLLLLLRWNVPPLVIVALAELREILERWVYQVADYRDWQLEQIAEYGADGAAGSS
ncbi:hypothetical protein [Novosphingobium olei]|uniref:hypothetical protein n=1 Tax=Novosphingobium olei TaxID=2728851 RepID=UPI003092410F|nr:hypothetical protein NSDW_02810 [Novosphingobium olei]